MKSYAAKLLATRKVSQDNQGKKTAGVDGVKSLTPKLRLELAKRLKLTGKSQPTRRVWIPKPGKSEKRPLGIPTMEERALQALAKLALEPEWEARFEAHSYGFRPGRSAHDAISAIFIAINQKAKYVLDADIAQCFDQINHQELLRKLNTFPTLRRQIKAWLESGVMEKSELFETVKGTPQGGVISPLLANIALHGMAEQLKNLQGEKDAILIKYADDFVILHENKSVVKTAQDMSKRWLEPLGLELKAAKTRVCHTSEGFNFLGFNIRQYPTGEYRAAKNSIGKSLGFTTLIKPSQEAIKRHLDGISRVIDAHHGKPQKALIEKLNSIIIGWCNYYSTVVSKEVFHKCNHLLYLKLLAWAKRQCTGSSTSRIIAKYWRKIGEHNWTFATHEGQILYQHSETPISRHTKVKGNKSPFDGDLVYWGQRLAKHPELSTRVAKLLRRQNGKCQLCGLYFQDGDLMEIDHIQPRLEGGKDVYTNLQLLHRHCHDVKSAFDNGKIN